MRNTSDVPRNWEEHYSDPARVDWTPSPLLVETVDLLPPGARSISRAVRDVTPYLAQLGWARDGSRCVARRHCLLRERAAALPVDARIADLERHEFGVAPAMIWFAISTTCSGICFRNSARP